MNIPLLLITAAGISQGIANTIRKASSTTQHRATTITTTTMIVNGLLTVPLLFYQFRLPAHSITWVWVILSAISFAFSMTYMFKSYQHMDLSVSSLLLRSNILFVAVIGVIVLGERLSGAGIAGLMCLFVGNIVVLFEKRRVHLTQGAWYAILAAVFGAFASVLDKLAIADFSPYTYAFVNSILVGLAFVWRKNTLNESLQFFRKFPVHILSSSLFGVSAFTVLLVVLSYSQVSQATPVYRTVSFFVPVILGITLYRETDKIAQKIIGLSLAVAGTLLLYS